MQICRPKWASRSTMLQGALRSGLSSCEKTNATRAAERVLNPGETRLFDAGLLGGWNLQPMQQHMATVPGVSVTVVARPEAVIWSLGDGTVVTCDGPGLAFDSTIPATAQTPTCSHTFTRSSASRPGSAFEASVTVRWRASWTVTGAAGGGDLGVIERTAAFPIRVGEVQAINTPAG